MGNCVGTQARTTPECPRHKPTVRASTATVSTNHNSHSKMLPSDLLSEIAAVLSDLLPMWKEPKARDLDVSIISGGISNALYRVSLRRAVASPFDAASFTYEASTGLPADEIFQQTVVLRVYGENTEKFVDRAKEVETMRMLHKHGFGPEVLGVFGNGRVESYLRGKACLAPDDLGKEEMSERIAETLARFHLISSAKLSRSRRRQLQEEFPVPRPEGSNKARTPFQKTRTWLETSKTVAEGYTARQREIWEGLGVDGILEEVRQLEAKADAFKSPLAFTHNDLLSGNIMVDISDCVEDEKRREEDDDDGRTRESASSSSSGMTFIDFEYADWAPRGFDLGNHFCEYAGFDCDYSKYPDASHGFVRAYLRVYDGAEPSEGKVAQVVREANVFALAAHLYWGAWSMLQATWSSIDFDYMSYAKLRVDEYYKRKQDFLGS